MNEVSAKSIIPLCNAIMSNDKDSFKKELAKLGPDQLNTLVSITDTKINVSHQNVTVLFLSVFYEFSVVEIRALFEKGANPNVENTYPALVLASRYGPLPLIELFFVFGANPNIADPELGLTPLHMAAQSGLTDIVKLLIARNATINAVMKQFMYTPLTLAAKNGHESTVILLCQRGAEPGCFERNKDKESSPLAQAVFNDQDKILKILLGFIDERKYQELLVEVFDFAFENKLSRCKNVLLEYIRKFKLLEKALTCFLSTPNNLSSRDKIEEIIREGADVNGTFAGINSGDHSNKIQVTPLYLCAQIGNAAGLQILLNHGADPSVKSSEPQVFPLYVAAYNGHDECVKILCQHQHPNADLMFKQLNSGQNSLAVSVSHLQTKCVKHILDAIRERKITLQSEHYVAFQRALGCGNQSILSLFLEHGFPILGRGMNGGNALLYSVIADQADSLALVLNKLREGFVYKDLYERALALEKLSMNHLLFVAYVFDSKQSARVLIQFGADGNDIYSGQEHSAKDWCAQPGQSKADLSERFKRIAERVVSLSQNDFDKFMQTYKIICQMLGRPECNRLDTESLISSFSQINENRLCLR